MYYYIGVVFLFFIVSYQRWRFSEKDIWPHIKTFGQRLNMRDR